MINANKTCYRAQVGQYDLSWGDKDRVENSLKDKRQVGKDADMLVQKDSRLKRLRQCCCDRGKVEEIERGKVEGTKTRLKKKKLGWRNKLWYSRYKVEENETR